MKKTVLTALLLFAVNSCFSQLSLPYQQDFATLSGNYPPGWQGVLLDGNNVSVFDTAAFSIPVPLSSGNAGTTAGGVYNFSGCLGWLNTAASNYAVMFSISASSLENIAVRYQVKTVRKTNKICESILQYRTNGNGSFKNIIASRCFPDTVQEIILPPECDNQPVVDLRWVSRDYDGTGARPSLAIDDISIFSRGKDTGKPVVRQLLPFQQATSQATVLQLRFDEEVVKGAGNIYFNTDTLSVGDPAVTVSGRMVIIRKLLLPGQRYFITIDSTAFKDRYGNLFKGIPAQDNWFVDVTQYDYRFSFDDCIKGSNWPGGGFTAFSRKGAAAWSCANPGLEINGYNNGPTENEDWLISPSLDLRSFQFPLLNYRVKKEFEGPALRVKISRNYQGHNDPRSASWTEIPGNFTGQADWYEVNGINLSPFRDSNVHIALVYISDKIQQAAKWTVSQVYITDTSDAPPLQLTVTPGVLDFGYADEPLTDSVSYWFNDVNTKVRFSAPAGFLVSADGENYYREMDDSLRFSGKLYLKFLPSFSQHRYEGALTISNDQQLLGQVILKGNTIPALKIVNWNVSWFGSPAAMPADDSLQEANVLKVLKRLKAAIYGLVEIVDTNRLRSVVNGLPGYDFVVSGTDSLSGISYARAQKPALVYDRSRVKVLHTRLLLQYSSNPRTRFNWSGGRYPFLAELEANDKGGDTCWITLVLVHAKANTGDSGEQELAWERRQDGVKELKDTLDKYFSHVNLLVLGDFNDDLTRTVVRSRADTISSWAELINDPRYVPFTLPLSRDGERSTLHFPGVIDHVVGTNGMMVAHTEAGIQAWVKDWVPAYGSTTSDHYPVASSYSWQVLGNPFPVKGLHAVVSGAHIDIGWEMPYLVNCADIAVERLENVNKLIAILPGPAGGSSKENITFAVKDTFASSGLNCYRLKITGLDEKIQYSAPVYVFNPGSERNIWYIAGGQLHYWLNWSQREEVPIQLIDLHGRIICQGRVSLDRGYNYNTMFIGRLSMGVYFLRIGAPGRLLVLKILVNH